MAFSFPRISITVDDGNEHGTQGELGILAFGFALHLAWAYCAFFNARAVFFNAPESALLAPFLVTALASFAALTLFSSITDQKFLRYYTDRFTMMLAGAFCLAGSIIAFLGGLIGLALPLYALAGVLCGVGAALFTMLWGTAYARYNTASIVLNAVVAVVCATLLYSLIIHVFPWPVSGAIVCLLPLCELPLLWRLTPISYALRHAVPIFNPLPIRKTTFLIRFSIPICLFGIVLGALTDIGLVYILPSVDPTIQLIALFAGGTAAIVLVVVSFSIDKRSHWDFIFRPLVPFVAITCLFLPWFQASEELVPSLLLLTGFLCLASLMWVLLGQLSQEFRLSPICMFGIGSFAIAIGSLAGIWLVETPWVLAVLPYGQGSIVIVLLVSLMVAMALLPRVRDIKRLILPHQGTDNDGIASFNDQIDQAKALLEQYSQPIWNASLDAVKTYQAPLSTQATPELINWVNSQISSVETSGAPQDDPNNEEQKIVRGRFRTQCEEIANRYLLSRRETEVMFLLAKGHNAAFIQDKLCISKSTAKTHISHIYRKLDIHNQQELLAMVDAARNEE